MNIPHIAFIGGGNMASAILGGLLRQGVAASDITVVEPYAPQREKLLADFKIAALPQADVALAKAGMVVWAVKPQSFKDAAASTAAFTASALHLSVMAGITTDAMAQALGSERIVRAMPNTPALIGRGIAGLYARAAKVAGVSAADQALVERVMASTGEHLWVAEEAHIDAVTALSGSGPAYVFFFIEAMMRAGQSMGLSADQSRRLAQSTFAGAAELARQSPDEPAVLRQRVTSKGGTTYAALMTMEQHQMGPHFEAALHAACDRAAQLGQEFGR
jgi:pyrroline-5-carboxylate reductase